MANMTKAGAIKLLEEFRKLDPAYADRIPEVTSANMLQVGEMIGQVPNWLNDFAQSIMNKTIDSYVRSNKFENPLARFKRASEEYGDGIEEIQTGIAKARIYDMDRQGTGKTLLMNHDPEVHAAYHRINRKVVYPTTVMEDVLKKALVTPGGLERVVSNIIDSLALGNEIDEYTHMKQMVEGAYKSGDLYLVEVGDIEADATKFIKKARAYHKKLKFPNTLNKSGVMAVSDQDNLSVIIPVDISAEIDVGTLAGAFNMDKTTFLGKQVEVDELYDKNIVGVMIQDDFFVVQDKQKRVASSFFPDSLKTNYFMHVEQILSRSPFASAIAFVKEIPKTMKYRLIASAQSFKLDEDIKERVVSFKLDGFDGTAPTEDYTLEFSFDNTAVATAVADDVEKTVTFTLKDDAPAGAVTTVTVKAMITDDLDEPEVLVTREITIQRGQLNFKNQ